MPKYAYACTDCGHRFDIVQSFSDDTLTSCPECEGRLRKVFNSVGVVFKGSGFYRNDSRAGNGSPARDGSSPEGAPSGTSETADAQPAAAKKDSSTAASGVDGSSTKPAAASA